MTMPWTSTRQRIVAPCVAGRSDGQLTLGAGWLVALARRWLMSCSSASRSRLPPELSSSPPQAASVTVSSRGAQMATARRIALTPRSLCEGRPNTIGR